MYSFISTYSLSFEAKHIKKGQCLFLDKSVFVVVDVEELTKGNHTVKVTVENFMTNHRTVKRFGLTHRVRTLEPSTTRYELTDLGDHTGDGKQYLTLLNKSTDELEECLYVDNVDLVDYLTKHFSSESVEDKTLDVTVTRVDAGAAHSGSQNADSDMSFEKVTAVQGFDMKHLYDHNRHHHHDHHTHHAHSSHEHL